MKIKQTKKRIVAFLYIALLSTATMAQFSSKPIELVVNVTYIDVHWAPGRGYPKFHALGKGEQFVVLKQRTDWIKIEFGKNKTGWIKAKHLSDTLTSDGKAVRRYQ